MIEGSRIKGKLALSGTGLPVLPPRNAIVELAAIVLAIVFVDWLLPNQDLSEIGPNPYWLPVLLMSLQYGTVSGLLAAGVGIAMTMLPGVPAQGVGENHFAYLLRIWAQPILWIAVAVLLGQFRIRQIAVKSELVQQVQELSAQRQALADYAGNLRTRCETIERLVAGRDEPAGFDVLAAMAALGHGDEDLGDALGRVASLVMPGAEMSVYQLDGSRLRRVADAGWREGRVWADELTAVHPLYRAVVERGEGVSVLERGREATLSGEGLAAVPIRAADGAVAGMLKLDHADAAAVVPGTLPALEAMAMAIGHRFAPRRAAESRADAVAGDAGTVRGFFSRTSTWLRRPASPQSAEAGEAPKDSAGGSTGRTRVAR